MPCCGSRLPAPAPLRGDFPPQAPPGRPPVRAVAAAFLTYHGRTALDAIGPVTGRRYRFAAPGARVAVDPRDAPGLLRIPALR